MKIEDRLGWQHAHGSRGPRDGSEVNRGRRPDQTEIELDTTGTGDYADVL